MKTSRKITVKVTKAIKAVKGVKFPNCFVTTVMKDVNDFNENQLMYT